MLRRWRNKARVSSASSSKQIPSDVPSGHIAVCVGSSCRRFLLTQAEEEYGFSNQGPLTIPCDESVFEEAIRSISRSDGSNRLEDLKSMNCNPIRRKPSELWTESRPLLAEKPTIW
ncbi:unnamed protein product [Linum tenue]|uniref:Uncharacterized protein n=1 Tax=Linum tenue TaxID=586396 RepID=A0AAV0HBU1_9ROSI|nr:unnamed protein product [Linum tenue]CAI0382774.1 unnamed protein product [Linum tenue]